MTTAGPAISETDTAAAAGLVRAPREETARPAWAALALDRRSIALFRIALAVLLAGMFGVWSAAFVSAADQGQGLTPATAAHALVLGLLAVATLSLLAGWMSRLAALLAMACVLGVHALDPQTLTPGTTLLRLMLLWAALLPLGERYAIDSAVDGASPSQPRVCSPATVGLLLLLLVVYLLPAAVGDHAPLRSITPLARAVEAQPWWPRGDTWVEAAEAAGFGMLILAFAFTGGARVAAALTMAGLHAVLGLALEMGLLQLALAALWLVLLPSPAWDGLQRWLWTPDRRRVRLWHSDRDTTQAARVRLLRTFLLLPPDAARPTSEDIDMDVFRRQRDSWVVCDASGYRYVKFRALSAAFQASPIFWPVGALLHIGFIESIGDWVYEHTKRRPGPVVLLATRVGPPATTPWHHAGAAVLLGVLLVWQLRLAAEPAAGPAWAGVRSILHLLLGG